MASLLKSIYADWLHKKTVFRIIYLTCRGFLQILNSSVMPSNKFPEVQFCSIESFTFKCIEELTSKGIQSKGCWMSATRFEVLSWLEICSGTPEVPRGSIRVIGKIFMGFAALKYGKLSIYKQAQKLVLIDALDLHS